MTILTVYYYLEEALLDEALLEGLEIKTDTGLTFISSSNSS